MSDSVQESSIAMCKSGMLEAPLIASQASL
jgi:hypothetical protein